MNAIQETIRSEPAYRPHVLLMEDEMNVAKGLEMVMREEGYEVDLADTGQGALDKFRTSEFDLLVADLRLPDMDGMEVVQHVCEKRPRTNVVIITGYPSVSSAVQAVKLGVSDYLRKPFTEDEFKTAVKSALKEKEACVEMEEHEKKHHGEEKKEETVDDETGKALAEMEKHNPY